MTTPLISQSIRRSDDQTQTTKPKTNNKLFIYSIECCAIGDNSLGGIRPQYRTLSKATHKIINKDRNTNKIQYWITSIKSFDYHNKAVNSVCGFACTFRTRNAIWAKCMHTCDTYICSCGGQCSTAASSNGFIARWAPSHGDMAHEWFIRTPSHSDRQCCAVLRCTLRRQRRRHVHVSNIVAIS